MSEMWRRHGWGRNWSAYKTPSVNLGSSTIVRVEVGEADPTFTPRPVGFTARLVEAEPLVWEGDDA